MMAPDDPAHDAPDGGDPETGSPSGVVGAEEPPGDASARGTEDTPGEDRQTPEPVTVTAPIDREASVMHGADGVFSWRWTYRRSADSQRSGAVGQDFLTFRHTADRFVFALCDGVGQSFFGEIAAQVVGSSLVDWLWGSLPGDSDDDDADGELAEVALQRGLTGHLADLTETGTRIVNLHELPADLQPMLATVLEQKRSEGSASTFVAGRLDVPSAERPKGRLVLAWLGDSRVRLWNGDGERVDGLADTFTVGAAWSTRDGTVGDEPHVLVDDLTDAQTYVAAYSDGLAGLDAHARPLFDAELDEAISAAQDAPASDDIALIEVWLTRVPEQEQPVPSDPGGSTDAPAPLDAPDRPAAEATPPAPGASPVSDDGMPVERTGAERETPAPDAAFVDATPTQPMLPALPPAAVPLEEPSEDAEPAVRDDPERVEARLPSQGRVASVRMRRARARRARRPSMRLVVAVLLLGILVGLLLGIAGSSLFGGWMR
jgi:hypothetical protein